MKHLFVCLSFLLLLFDGFSWADGTAPAPDLPNSYQLSNDQYLTKDAHAFVSKSGIASLIYATRISYENDPYDDFLSYMTFDGLSHHVTLATTTDDANLAVRSPSIVNAQHVNPDHPSSPPGIYRHHATYILYGRCLGLGQVLSGAVVFVSSFDGGTTWDSCGNANIIPGLFNVTSLDMAIDSVYAAPYDKVGAAFARDSDGDGDSDKLYYALNINDNTANFASPIIIAEEDPAHPSWQHNYKDVSLQIDAAGKYHIVYVDEWEKESIPLSSKRIMYASNSGGGILTEIASFPWASNIQLLRKSLMLDGSTRYVAYTDGANVRVVSSADGTQWLGDFDALGSQPSLSGSSATVDLAYIDEDGKVVYVENNGLEWSAPFEVRESGHHPFMAVNDIVDEDGSVVDVARHVFYFKPDLPRTSEDEIFVRTNQIIQDRIPPYVRLIWPLSGVWTSANTAILGQDQENPRLAEECRIDENIYHSCNFTSAGTKLGDLPEYAAIPDNGVFALGIRDHDAAMNYGVDSQSGIKKDGLAPNTSDDYAALDDTWQTTLQTVILTPSDPGQAGVNASGLDCSLYQYGTYCDSWTKYCLGSDCAIDNVNGLIYAAPIDFSTEGVSVLKYASKDVAGNIQIPVSRKIKLDFTDPVVDAGPDLVAGMASMIDATTSDSPSGLFSWQWVKSEGPGVVNFGSPNAEDTTVSMLSDGIYALQLNVEDNAGRTNSDIMQVIWDTTKPELFLNGAKNITVEVDSSYQDAGAVAVDNLDLGINSKITTYNPVDSSIVGDYVINYNVSDHAGNSAIPLQRSVSVVDTQRPIITLNGSAVANLEVGSTYEDAGAMVTDNYDNDILSRLVVVNPVDVNRVGTYIVKYNVSDSSGNAAEQLSRTVNVVDTTKPIIQMLGDNPAIVEKFSEYKDSGAEAFDNYDGDISSNMQATSSVNTSIVGDYSVIYAVSDANGNVAEPVLRLVKVVSKGRLDGKEVPLPLISTLKKSKNKYELTTLQGEKKKVQPFAKSYKKKIWARKVDFGMQRGSVYLFAPLGVYKKGAIIVYGNDGRRLKVIKPFGRYNSSGFNIDIEIEPLNDVVYMAVAAKKAGRKVNVYEVNSGAVSMISSLRVGKSAGNVDCKFLKNADEQSRLVTTMNRRHKQAWKYLALDNQFVLDSSSSAS